MIEAVPTLLTTSLVLGAAGSACASVASRSSYWTAWATWGVVLGLLSLMVFGAYVGTAMTLVWTMVKGVHP